MLVVRERPPVVYSDGLTADDLATLLSRPAWMLDALCRDPAYRSVNFFPVRGESAAPALAVCSGCLVRAECAAMGIDGNERGVWGGLSGADRRKLRTPSTTRVDNVA